MNSLQFLVILFGFFFTIQASPLIAPRADLTVFVPKITSPTCNSIWNVGQTATVQWSTDNAPPPADISNAASIKLVPANNTSSQVVLASGFSLLAGEQDVTVPSGTTPGTYYIILFGDSGDTSQTFQIL